MRAWARAWLTRKGAEGGGSRTLQQDLDLYRAVVLTTLKNQGSEDVEGVGAHLMKRGRRHWSGMLREQLDLQMKPLMQHVKDTGGQDPYPVPKKKERGGAATAVAGGTVLEQVLDYKGRDLDIEEKPVKHPREEWSIQVVKSGIVHREAGFGVLVKGRVAAGTVLCIYPGKVWWPSTYRGPAGNEYAISRYDGIIVDALDWDSRARDAALQQHAMSLALGKEGAGAVHKFRNPFAVGSFVNHPPPNVHPNVIQVPYDFAATDSFVPHDIAATKPLSLLNQFAGVVPSVLLVASRNLRDEELFLNYRFNPALPYPDWYWQPDLAMAQRRWAKHSFFNLF